MASSFDLLPDKPWLDGSAPYFYEMRWQGVVLEVKLQGTNKVHASGRPRL